MNQSRVTQIKNVQPKEKSVNQVQKRKNLGTIDEERTTKRRKEDMISSPPASAAFNLVSSRFSTQHIKKESSVWQELQALFDRTFSPDQRGRASKFYPINLTHQYLVLHGMVGNRAPNKLEISQVVEITNESLSEIYNLAKTRQRLANFNLLTSVHLQQHPVQTKLINSTTNEYQLFYTGDYSSIKQSLNSGVVARYGRFGKAVHLYDSLSSANQYTPCSKCGRGDALSDTVCSCKSADNYAVLLCHVVLGNFDVENGFPQEPTQKNNGIMVEDIYRGGCSRVRQFIVWDNGCVLPKYLIFFNRK